MKIKHSNMSNYIPLEIQLEIMKRLPIKSLIRFRSACKPWKSMVDSSEFITHSQKRNLLVTHENQNVDQKYVSINIDGDNDHTYFTQHNLSLPKSFSHPKIVIGSSQGLVCMYPDYPGNFVVLCNPTIRKSVVIDMPPDAFNKLDHSWETIFGFGVCPHTRDPKLVKIICSNDESDQIIPWQQVKVFTLSEGVWRTPLCSNVPWESVLLTWNQVAIDRFIYWRAFGNGEPQWYNLIMSFDMISEEFTQIRLPDILAYSDCISLSLFELKESLVVVENDYTLKKGVWNVWMMMTHGVLNSFNKLYTINTPDASIQRVLGFRKSGEPIIIMTKDSDNHIDSVFIYEPCTQLISYIGISGKLFSVLASSYTETLLLLNHQDHHICFEENAVKDNGKIGKWSFKQSLME